MVQLLLRTACVYPVDNSYAIFKIVGNILGGISTDVPNIPFYVIGITSVQYLHF